MYYDQAQFDVKCEWGATGIRALSSNSDCLVIVDVFSFSTVVDIALTRGAIVYPFEFGDLDAAAKFASEKNAEIVGKRAGSALSFTPRSMLQVAAATRLVLPSANGATLSLMTGTVPTLTGCLRNRRAVAAHALKIGPKVAVIPSGERWEDQSLRPAVEDWIAAGSIIAELPGTRSPEATAAVAAFHAAKDHLESFLKCTSSCAELLERHYQDDAKFAAELDCSPCVPRLVDRAYVNVQCDRTSPQSPSPGTPGEGWGGGLPPILNDMRSTPVNANKPEANLP